MRDSEHLNGVIADIAAASSEPRVCELSNSSLPPWSPWMAFANAFLLGPLAGVLVTHINLTRLGLGARSRTMLWGGMLGAALFALANALTELPRYLNFVITLAWAYHLYSIQEPACSRWKSEHHGSYRSGWSTLGWGVLGLVILVAMSYLFQFAFAPRVAADGVGR